MPDQSRLSQIETMWSMVRQSQDPKESESQSAQQLLLNRYENAIRRYLVVCVKSVDAADEIYQEFALRFVRGDFKNANAEHGRFRSFLKTTLYRLVVDHFRVGKRNFAINVPDNELPDRSPEEADSDASFTEQWRTELLLRAFAALKEFENQTGRRFHTVMQLRTDNPKASSTVLAELLTARTGSKVSPTNARVLLHRAREKFANLLIDEVTQTLSSSSLDDIEEELAELKLLVHCRDAINKRRSSD